ncbi:MAG: NAD-dependent epimerase/dehydratase family protein [SAR324 cluster bacterium]|nr:NAD-dependent epimerase/dehydratase family protein [SAR324 cluster bacterium]
MKTYIVTGAAGFIGFHTALRLLEAGQRVIGIDNLNEYYDVQLKKNRIALLESHGQFTGYPYDLADLEKIKEIFQQHPIDTVCHLAAQAGVRYSIQNPFAYQKSNLEAFLNILELSRQYQVSNFVYASSSSVYGKNKKLPFSVKDRVDHPISLYAATKKSNELIAHSYSHLYDLPTTGLRFFTVYGPWGRPDMALFLFTKAILNGDPIDVYNHGNMKRDFTYIDDIVSGVVMCLDHPQPYEILNIGNHRSEDLEYFIEIIENCIGKKAKRNYLPLQAGDVMETYADIDRIRDLYGYEPATTIEEGIPRFVQWYREYYKV